jgi:hypothetical protein
MMGGGSDPQGMGSHGGGQPEFRWKTPEGWEERPAGGMRQGSWRVRGEPRTDCSLVVLSGGGGGLLANVNRWRGEMGLGPLDQAGLAQLPRHQLLGGEAVYVNMAGRFSGGRGRTGAIENARVLGLILQLPQAAVFLKFSGPAKVVEDNTSAFEALADSVALGGGGAAHASAHDGGGRAHFAWTTPAGWDDEPAGGMRQGSWRVHGEPKTDCSLVVLAGGGGGMLANVNRWRGEMGLQPLDAAGLAKLPRHELLGGQAVYVDMTGRFSGGRGRTGAIDDARMLGLILEVGQAALFLKFTGPAKVVGANRAAFEALASSLGPGGEASADPHAGGAPQGAGTDAGGYAFDVPKGWTQQPARMMRVATFVPDDLPAAWCYITRLAGDGGGLDLNVNRWRGEMGQAPLDAAALAKLERIPMLGGQAVLLDVEGDFHGTGGPALEKARMVGAICERPGHVVFVKMVGPAASLQGEVARFRQLCSSLREK